jgi:hypothetical protein
VIYLAFDALARRVKRRFAGGGPANVPPAQGELL